MARFRPGHKLVLRGHGFDEAGPHLTLNDLDANEVVRYPVRGRTFTLSRTGERRCTGRFDLATHQASACPDDTELLPGSKDTQCPACQEATGFNPSFYYALSVSPQQRAYNATPHFAYLAYFSPQHVKAGISSEGRGIRRLLDQGARAARVVGRFPDAYAARECEAGMCLDERIYETMRVSKKVELLANVRYDFAEACGILDEAAARLGLRDTAEPCLDLTPYYFGDAGSPACDTLRVAEGPADCCAGLCAGMVGGTLVLQQNGVNYLVPVNDWEAHVVELHEDEVLHEYEFEPLQMSLL